MQSSGALSAYRKCMRIKWKIALLTVSEGDSGTEISLISGKNQTNFPIRELQRSVAAESAKRNSLRDCELLKVRAAFGEHEVCVRG